MHIYAFGSICRGDMSLSSDIDLLAIVEGHDSRFDPNVYSIYSYRRIQEIWQEGNPFAWHLSLESKLLFSSDKRDFLKLLGSPLPYKNCAKDCAKFFSIFCDAYVSVLNHRNSRVFDLSTIFLSIRNFATCFSLGMIAVPDFSRNSALHLEENSIPIPSGIYEILERSRVLCTRGYGAAITDQEVEATLPYFDEIHKWMSHLLQRTELDA
jgi:hypothetical protein